MSEISPTRVDHMKLQVRVQPKNGQYKWFLAMETRGVGSDGLDLPHERQAIARSSKQRHIRKMCHQLLVNLIHVVG